MFYRIVEVIGQTWKRNHMNVISKVFLGVGVLASVLLVWLLLLPSSWQTFSEQGSQLTAMVWGQISLLDLYAGFFLSLVLVWMLEPKLWVKVLLSVLLPVLGNPVLALWLVLRFSYLSQKLRPS